VPSKSHAVKPRSGTRYGGGTRGAPHAGVSYSETDPQLLLRAVAAVTAAGDAITLGLTSDGGAYYVGCIADGLLEKFYLDSCDALEDRLRGIAEAGEALVV